MVSIIIPIYNEGRNILYCLDSLSKQTDKDIEIIAVDDGSTDKTFRVLSEFPISNFQFPIKIVKQKHLGPALARNLGVKHAKGNILVFVDADMTFDKHFISTLIKPILTGKSKGTFTREEYVSNWNNVWARCWNYNEGIKTNRRIPENFPNQSPVFRAILKSEFERVNGFDNIGFTDDWTLSRKLGFQASLSDRATCFHNNPETLNEVFLSARWIGKNEFISGTLSRKFISLVRYNLLLQTIRGIFLTLYYQELMFIAFSFIYYSGINISILFSFANEQKSK